MLLKIKGFLTLKTSGFKYRTEKGGSHALLCALHVRMLVYIVTCLSVYDKSSLVSE